MAPENLIPIIHIQNRNDCANINYNNKRSTRDNNDCSSRLILSIHPAQIFTITYEKDE